MIGKLRNMTAIYLFKGDDAKACVLRELNEELGLSEGDIQNLALRYIALRRTNGEIRQNYYFFANLKENISDDLASNEGKVKWFSLKEIDDLEMPHTAKYVMKHYCSVGQFSDKLYVGATNEEGVEFAELPEF